MENHKILCLKIVLLFFLSSCSSGTKVIRHGVATESPYTLTLSEDSTFTYRYKFGPKYEYSDGIWEKLRPNAIKLQSNLQKRTLSLKAVEKSRESNQGIVAISTNVGIPVKERSYYSCSTFINGDLYDSRNCDSLGSLSVTSKVDSLYFMISADRRIPNRFLDTLRTDSYYPRVNVGVNLEVEILYMDELFNYRVFRNQIFKVPRKAFDDLPVALELRDPSTW